MPEAVTPVEEGAQVPSKMEGRKVWLEPILSLAAVTEEDLKHLLTVCKVDHTGVKPEHVLKDAAFGRVQLWRVAGKTEGILVTRLLRHVAGLELHIYMAAGNKLLPNMKELFQDIEAFAKAQGARWIGADALNKRLASTYKRATGMAERGVYLLKEL